MLGRYERGQATLPMMWRMWEVLQFQTGSELENQELRVRPLKMPHACILRLCKRRYCGCAVVLVCINQRSGAKCHPSRHDCR